jgi:hypothetical protein
MNAAATIARLGGEQVQIERLLVDGHDSQGRRVAAVPVTFDAVAAVHSVTGRDLARLPEGVRESIAIVVYSSTELRVRDRLVRGGERFEVEHVEPWQFGGFWRAACSRVGG